MEKDVKKQLFKDSEKLALNTFIKLMRATESFNKMTNLGFKEAGLTESQFGILEALYHLGSMCQSKLGEKILKSRGNITLVIDNLEKQGLVERIRSKEDRRYIEISLTKSGESLIKKVFPKHSQEIANFFSILTEGEIEKLGEICKKLGTQSR